MVNHYPKVTIGILFFHSRKYLPYCLSSLSAQTYPNLEILLLDNANGEGGDYEWVRKHYPDLSIKKAPNPGFGSGHNRLIRQAQGQFYACLNVDMRFGPAFIEELVKAIQKDPKIAVATGKLLRWNFENNRKTKEIDSVGLRFLRSHRFEDEGQGQRDAGQYDTEREIFGASGAAFLARIEALRDVAFVPPEGAHRDVAFVPPEGAHRDVAFVPPEGAQNFVPFGGEQYFDELMFMYKEDIDLMYRLQWAGWKAVYTPKAVAWHDRTIANTKGSGPLAVLKNRAFRPRQIKEWSYLNHQIMLHKNFGPYSMRTRLAAKWYRLKTELYISLFERYLTNQRKRGKELMPKITQRRLRMKRRVPPARLEDLMQ